MEGRHMHTPNAHRTTARVLLLSGLAAASLGVAGCGLSTSGSAKAPTILNTQKVEQAIAQSSWEQRKKRAAVSCPSGVHQKKGLTFSCVAVVKNARTTFAVTQIDGAGHVHYAAR
jgi:hypothetical protein